MRHFRINGYTVSIEERSLAAYLCIRSPTRFRQVPLKGSGGIRLYVDPKSIRVRALHTASRRIECEKFQTGVLLVL